jgi:hypothetical protein
LTKTLGVKICFAPTMLQKIQLHILVKHQRREERRTDREANLDIHPEEGALGS